MSPIIRNQSSVTHEDGNTMNLKNAKKGRGSGRIAAILLLALASGAGCSTVSCKWAYTSVADGAPVAAGAYGDDPCRPDKAEQYTIPPLLGEPGRR